MKELISVIVPVYNEEDNILLLYEELNNVWKKLKPKYDCEIIFVNDGSIDSSDQVIERLLNEDNRIKYIEFSRNFGKEVALTAGLNHAKGIAAIMLDADLQHPVSLIPKFIEKWRDGAEIVVGVCKQRRIESLINQLGAKLFYKIMDFVGEGYLVPYATDYRLIGRKVIDEFNKLTEGNRMTRGLLDWLGFKKNYLYFSSKKRNFGKSGYSTLKRLRLAFSSLVSLSLFPLRLAGYLGVSITFSSGVVGLFILINQYILDKPVRYIFSGVAALAIFIMFLIGIVLVSLGLISLYIANIHNEVLNRPMYVIRTKKL